MKEIRIICFIVLVAYTTSLIPLVYHTQLNDKEVINTIIEQLNQEKKLSCESFRTTSKKVTPPIVDEKNQAYHHILPKNLIKQYLINSIKIIYSLFNAQEKEKIAENVNRFIIRTCKPGKDESFTLHTLLRDDKKDKKETTVNALVLFIDLLVWHPKILVRGPLPTSRDYDPGDSFDYELIKNCPDEIKEDYRSMYLHLMELSKEQQLVDNIYKNPTDFKIFRDDRSLIGQEFLKKVAEIYKKNIDVGLKMMNLKKQFSIALISEYFLSDFYRIVPKLEKIHLFKCKIIWIKNPKVKLSKTKKERERRWKNFKKSYSIGSTTDREFPLNSGYAVKENIKVKNFD